MLKLQPVVTAQHENISYFSLRMKCLFTDQPREDIKDRRNDVSQTYYRGKAASTASRTSNCSERTTSGR